MPVSEPERPRRPGSADEPPTYSISQARESLDDEMHHRMKRYLISMSVRTVCFVLAVVLDGWLRWTMAAAAIVLPYVAVVMANAGPPKGTHPSSPYTPSKPVIEGGPRPAVDTSTDPAINSDADTEPRIDTDPRSCTGPRSQRTDRGWS